MSKILVPYFFVLIFDSAIFFFILKITICVAVHSPAPPSFIYWYKEGRVINYSQRGGISVLTERKTRTSKLVISKAMSSDSGNYTCIPSSSGKFYKLFYFCLFLSYACFLLHSCVACSPAAFFLSLS